MSGDITRRHFLQRISAAALLPLLSRTGAGIAQLGKELAGSSLRFHFEPLVDLYLLLQKAVDEPATLPATWRPALEQMRRASSALPGGRDLSLLNGIVAERHSAAELSRVIGGMSGDGGGGASAAQSPVLAALSAVVDALRTAEPLYAAEIGPAHRALVAEVRRGRVEHVLVPRERQCLSYILSKLEIPDVGFEVPVFLVADAPSPGSVTTRSRRLTAACFVGVDAHPRTCLLEIILHEATHAFEVAAGPDADSVLNRFRHALQARGVQPSDAVYRTAPHTLMFVHSGETVRRLLDPDHVHYGDSEGYYAKVPAVAPAVRTHWIDHLDGRTSANEAIERMVSDIVRDAK